MAAWQRPTKRIGFSESTVCSNWAFSPSLTMTIYHTHSTFPNTANIHKVQNPLTDWLWSLFQIKSSFKSTYFCSSGLSEVGTLTDWWDHSRIYFSWFLTWNMHSAFLKQSLKVTFPFHLFYVSCILSLWFQQVDDFLAGPSVGQYWSMVTAGLCRDLTSSHTWCLGEWAVARTCSGQIVVCGPWSPTTVQCYPKEQQCQIRNVRKNVITFPWIL